MLTRWVLDFLFLNLTFSAAEDDEQQQMSRHQELLVYALHGRNQ